MEGGTIDVYRRMKVSQRSACHWADCPLSGGMGGGGRGERQREKREPLAYILSSGALCQMNKHIQVEMNLFPP